MAKENQIVLTENMRGCLCGVLDLDRMSYGGFSREFQLSDCELRDLATIHPYFLFDLVGELELEKFSTIQLNTIDWENYFDRCYWDYYFGDDNDNDSAIISFSVQFLKDNIKLFKRNPDLGWISKLTDEIADILLENKISPSIITKAFNRLKTTQHLALLSYKGKRATLSRAPLEEEQFILDLEKSIELTPESKQMLAEHKLTLKQKENI